MNQQRIGEVAEILLGYCENRRTFQRDKIMTVPARAYEDADTWRAEIELIYQRLPLMLAISCEVPRIGDYKAMEAVGRSVLIVRGKDGATRAFLNVCAHRWAPVVAEGSGNCSRFTCPFHGWTYNTEGALIGIPDLAKFGDIDRSTHGLKELYCEERHGMIFVCLAPGATMDLDRYYDGLLEDFADANLQDWTFLGARELVGANWKLVMQNFFESYHFATLHSNTVARDFVHNVSHFEGFGPNMRIGFPLHSIVKLRDTAREHWCHLETKNFSFMRYFYPNVTASLLPSDIGVFAQIFPGPTPDRSRIAVLYARKEPLRDDADRQAMEAYMTLGDQTLQDEDFAIGIEIQKRLQTAAHEGLLYGRNEPGNQYFHEWVNWHLQNDPTLPRPLLQLE